jgi:DNA-binding HxlR family transcriptional regulator
MGNKGYRAESRFETIIQNTLTVEKPMRYSEIWSRCSKAGMGSKQTLSKYLKRLEKTGLVIRDSSGYRRSALADYPKLSQLRKSLGEPRSKSWQYSYFTPSVAKNIAVDEFLKRIQQEFNLTIHIYAWMLTKLVQTNNGAAAQELVDIFMRSQINPVLDDLAKEIWLARKRVPLDALNALKRQKLKIIDR